MIQYSGRQSLQDIDGPFIRMALRRDLSYRYRGEEKLEILWLGVVRTALTDTDKDGR